MAFFNARLPDKVAAGFQGGPEFLTNIVRLQNGDEFRNKEWAYPRHRYSAEMGLFTDADRRDLLAALWVLGGAHGTFRFRDWNDYEVSGQALTVSVGTQTPVQLIKQYTFGGTTLTRQIKLPVRATVFEGATPVAGSLNTETGLFTPTSNWGSGAITWSGEFDVLVRFASDYNPLTAQHRKARTATIELQEVTA